MSEKTLSEIAEGLDTYDDVLPILLKEVNTEENITTWKKTCEGWKNKTDPLVVIYFKTHLFLMDQLRCMCDLVKMPYEDHLFTIEADPEDNPGSGRLIISSDSLQHKLKYRVREDIGEYIIKPGIRTFRVRCNISDLYDYLGGRARYWCDGMISHPHHCSTPTYKVLQELMADCNNLDEIEYRIPYMSPYNKYGHDPKEDN